MTRAELIAALEKAEVPSRKLDQAIWGTCAPHDGWCSAQGLAHVAWYDSYKAAPFTDSVDAALTLVPKTAALWRIDQFHSGESLRPWGWGATLRHPHGLIVGESRASMAIALCVAAIKVMNDKP